MPSLPPTIVPLLSPFASLCDIRTWRQVQILLAGVIPAPGRRTVSTALYVPGLHARGDFALFHHVLSRASWSSLAVSRVLLGLLGLLVQHLVPTGPLRLAVDETLERRWGAKIEALGVYLDRGICTKYRTLKRLVWDRQSPNFVPVPRRGARCTRDGRPRGWTHPDFKPVGAHRTRPEVLDRPLVPQ